jgi:queuine tRNA-ribosyltransferase
MSDGFSFKISKKLDNGLGRVGIMETPHGAIKTPAFIVVGTNATVKALTPEQIYQSGAQAILVNAYHLYLQPGYDCINRAGGIAKFMNWNRPTFSDSGGFQVLSLGSGYKKVLSMDSRLEPEKIIAKNGDRLAKIDDDGVSFKSHKDGSSHRFTPEFSMQIQHSIGADIIFAFDECTSLKHSYDYQVKSLHRTHQWALRCLKEHKKLTKKRGNKPYQALYGVVQGAHYQDLREQAAKFIGKLKFDGFGIGGALEKENLATIVRWVNSILPEEKPKHLLGLSEPDDIFNGVENGIDTFDCVAPARVARNASLYSPTGRFTIKKAQYSNDFSPVVEGCSCYTCTNFTKAYLNHLFRAQERLAATLATIHNEFFVLQLVNNIRQSIIDGEYCTYRDSWLRRYYG